MRTVTIVVHVEDTEQACELAHKLENVAWEWTHVLNVDTTNEETDEDEAKEIWAVCNEP